MKNKVVMDQLNSFANQIKKVKSQKKIDHFITQTKHILSAQTKHILSAAKQIHDSKKLRAILRIHTGLL
jgi:uncharacterized protein (UPF0335 family)